jgi:hypothetical protein
MDDRDRVSGSSCPERSGEAGLSTAPGVAATGRRYVVSRALSLVSSKKLSERTATWPPLSGTTDLGEPSPRTAPTPVPRRHSR